MVERIPTALSSYVPAGEVAAPGFAPFAPRPARLTCGASFRPSVTSSAIQPVRPDQAASDACPRSSSKHQLRLTSRVRPAPSYGACGIVDRIAP